VLHPAPTAGRPAASSRSTRRMRKLDLEIEENAKRLAAPSLQRHWDQFSLLIEILRFFGALDGPDGLEPTEWAARGGPAWSKRSSAGAGPDEATSHALHTRAERAAGLFDGASAPK